MPTNTVVRQGDIKSPKPLKTAAQYTRKVFQSNDDIFHQEHRRIGDIAMRTLQKQEVALTRIDAKENCSSKMVPRELHTTSKKRLSCERYEELSTLAHIHPGVVPADEENMRGISLIYQKQQKEIYSWTSAR